MDKFTFGLSVAAVGILVVFAGLVLLILFLKLFEFVFKNRQKAPAEKAVPVTQAPAIALSAQPAPSDEIAPEIIAAITAAISAVWQENTGFIVRRVRRIHTAPAWNRAGRDDQIYSRL
ncbi:MAG TPA: OadG family transporter subunit [Candidatus Limiplasma sp.]|nr:OadG family transporter subunit [Candidatus Limiplasma sp.]